jgi:hypothetical protein
MPAGFSSMPVTVQDLERVLAELNSQLREILFNRMILTSVAVRMAKRSGKPEAWLNDLSEDMVAALNAADSVSGVENDVEQSRAALEEFIAGIRARIKPN